jgi:signal transduction histidine kinase
MTRPVRSGTIAFRPRARLLKLIGEELISDEVVAISELVKNAHDADALTVSVVFRRVTVPEGEIEVRDDGLGMDLDTLLGRWMEPAASTKVGADRLITARGRRVLGEKGVGRFAADKLARHLEILSRCPHSPDELHAVIDWDLYDNDSRMLEDVKNHWKVKSAEVIRRNGTTLLMRGLRSVWTERMFRRLCLRLGRLLSPSREKDRFTIQIESDEFPEYSGELRSDILEKAPYWIEAQFDGQQAIAVKTNRTHVLRQRWNGHGELSCGPLRMRLFVFDLEGEAVARIGPRMEVRAWLKEWTGISIYRDGFRIWPYGEPHDDWLRLDQRRVNNPVEHLSNNQVIGFIDITRDGNPDLMDQTNREGLMNNMAFEDLRRVVYFVLQIIEAERQTVRHPVQHLALTPNGHADATNSISAELEQLAARAGRELGRNLRRVAQRLAEQNAKEHARQQKDLEGYTALAVIGQMAASLPQSLPPELGRMQADLAALRRLLATTQNRPARQSLDRIADTVTCLTGRLQMLQLGTGGNDRRRTIDVVAEIKSFRDSIGPLLGVQDIRMEVECPVGEVIRAEMRPEHFHCILQALISNSLDWLGQAEIRRLRVAVTADADCCKIVFSDSGPGIQAELFARVFEPGFSLKERGRGMGLTIAQKLVATYGGYIHVILDGRRKGANIRVVLPRKRSRATFYNGR